MGIGCRIDKTGQSGAGRVSTGISSGSNSARRRIFSEKRLFLKSEAGTRLVRLGPGAQLAAVAGTALVIGWSILSAAILAVDTINAGSFRDLAERERRGYEARIAEIAAERDARATETQRAHERFALAMDQISRMQTEFLASEERRSELREGLETVQATLRRTISEREAARAESGLLMSELQTTAANATAEELEQAQDTLDLLALTLTRTAVERDALAGLAAESQAQVDDLILEAQLTDERNDRIFSQLEEAVSVSVEPLDGMFRAVGLNPEALLDTVRSGREAADALGPIRISTKSGAPEPEAERANLILARLAEMDAYRAAADRAPFAMPLMAAHRKTSGFGPRWGRMHKGSDFAGAHGTAILATADGVVSFAGRQSGYGNIVKIRHEFGIETRYAHMSRIRVKVGQKVSRGDRIGDMGNTGRSTGTHLHYEVRVNGEAVDPMTYIEAARDVL